MDIIKKIVTNMLTDLGLKNGADGRGPHTFRHWLATYLHYEQDVSMMDIAFLFGDKVETIRDNYIHPTPRMLRRRVMGALRDIGNMPPQEHKYRMGSK